MPHPMSSSLSPEPLNLTMNQAIDMSRLSRSTLYRLAAAGTIPFVKAGSRTLVPFQSLKHYLTTLPAANIRPSVH
jgi:excisionase family DNA binding protein